MFSDVRVDKDVIYIYLCIERFIILFIYNIYLTYYIYIIYIYIYKNTVEYYSAITKNEIIPFSATWIDLEVIILSEGNQTEKDNYHTISLIRGI